MAEGTVARRSTPGSAKRCKSRIFLLEIAVKFSDDDAAHHPACNAGLRLSDDHGATRGWVAFDGAAVVGWVEEVD